MAACPFRHREDAGQKLGRALEAYRDTDALVLAIPRGGVAIGYEVARHLDADLSILIARKLPFPDNPESGFGAIAEDGSTYLIDGARSWVSEATIQNTAAQQKEEIQRRIVVLRDGKPLPELAGRTVILVDDGIAMGSTMRAAILACESCKAGKIVVGAPVSGRRTVRELREWVDEIVVLETPFNFQAVAQVYENWYDVSDEEVLEILRKWRAS